MRLLEFLDKRIVVDFRRKVDIRMAGLLLVLIFFGSVSSLYLIRGLYYQLTYPNYYERRENELKTIISRQPGDGGTSAELAMVMYLDGKKDKAINLVQQVYRDRPNDEMVMLYFGLMLSDSGRAQESVGVLSKLSNNYPGYQRDRTLFYLGKSLYDMGSFAQAIEKFSLCTQFNPGMTDAFLYIGKCKERLKDQNGALSAYQMVLKTDPGQTEAADAVRRLGRDTGGRNK